MNTRRYFAAACAAFVVIFLLDWVLHGVILSGMYQETATVWRPQEQMNDHVQWIMFAELLIALTATYIFTRNYENKGLAEGMRFGLLVGLLFAGPNFIDYAVLPIPLSLAFFWTLGYIAEFVLVGAVIAAVYKED